MKPTPKEKAIEYLSRKHKNKTGEIKSYKENVKKAIDIALEEQAKIMKSELKQKMYSLDWIKILDEAIKGRKTSWGQRPVVEWRNASDEVLMALVRHMEEADILEKKPKTYKFNFDLLK